MEQWSVERRGAVVVARHDHPPMNYLTAAGAGELDELIASWRDPEIRVVVLTGAVEGRFITHYSVEELAELSRRREDLIEAGAVLTDEYHALLQRLSDLPKPVIAAMSGDTMGGGFEIALACDIRIAQAGDHRIGFPEVKLGILPGGTGTQRLPRLIGAGAAIEFILRGRIVDPEAAGHLGLVHEVADDALERGLEVAEELAAMPPVSMAMVKRAVFNGVDLDLRRGLRIESDASFQTRISHDAVTAMDAYIAIDPEERRDYLEAGTLPAFQGR